ncbi:MAG: flagellar hook-length control protein FliK [Mobilitalea sp.]
MDIKQSSLSEIKVNKSSTVRLSSDSTSASESSKLKNTLTRQDLKQLDLKEGQIVKGQIIDHRYNSVSVQLEPGKQVITANLSGDVPLSIGQSAGFEVTESTNEHLVLKYLPAQTDTTSNSTIQKALTASGLPSTDQNKALVTELLDHRMPIDKQTLQTMMKYMYANRDAAPLTLVLMAKNQIPITAANIKQFEAYQNGTHQLLNDINSISKNISELLIHSSNTNSMSDNSTDNINLSSAQQLQATTNEEASTSAATGKASIQEAVLLNNKLVDILSNNAQTSPGNRTSINILDLPLSQVLGQEGLALLEKELVDAQTSNMHLLSSSLPSDLLEQVRSGVLSLGDAAKMITDIYHLDYEQLTSYLSNASTANTLDTSLLPATLQTLLEQSAREPKASDSLAVNLTVQDRTALLDLIKSFPDSSNIKESILQGTISLKDTLQYIADNLLNMNQTVTHTLLESAQYNSLLQKAFQQKWTITPDNLSKKDAVADLYKNLQNDLKELGQLASSIQNSSEKLALQEPVKNMQDNLSFMKNLNEAFTYLQLPIQFQNQDVHSDLYIFTNKKSLRENNGNVSVLLHLDMTNLGSVNIHLQMKGDVIAAKFYLDDSETQKLISDQLPSLTDALTKKGYILQAEVMQNQSTPDFTKDFIEQESQDLANTTRYTFDIRT